MSDSLSVSVQLRIEEVCTRFEAAWQAVGPYDTCPRIEAYLGGAAGLERGPLLGELLRLDLHYRSARGEHPGPAQYEASFPGDSAAVARAFAAAKTLPLSTGPFPPPGPPPEGAMALPDVAGYEVLKQLGRGGMGAVYLARDRALNRFVALKMIRAGRLATEQDVERFRREAQTAAALQHQNIVAIHEVSEHHGQPYFSMEYVSGGTLAGRLRGRPQPPEWAAQTVATLARAIHKAHEQKVIHRDLKPANVLFADEDTPKVADFGLAWKLDESRLEAPGALVGTLLYMAPEQAEGRGEAVGPATDIHALGLILYEILTGRPLFQGPTVAQTLAQVLTQEPVPPSRLQSTVSADLDSVCLKCLAKKPADRYESADRLAQDLKRCAEGLPPLYARPAGLLRTLRDVFSRRRYVAEYLPVAGSQLARAVGIKACLLVVALLLEVGAPEWLLWPALFSWYVPLFWSFRADWERRGPSAGPAERLMWATWLGHAAAFAVVCAGNRLTAAPGDGSAAVLASYPALAALTGLASFVMGSSFWTRHYLFGAIWLLSSVLMALAPRWAPLAAAVLGGGESLMIGLYLRRLARGTDPAEGRK
jgi:tRNA A-37 threonylcarbamoyl transferase component Bud32